MDKFLIVNIGELVTLSPLASENRFTAINDNDLGRVQQAWLAVESGSVVASGTGKAPDNYKTWPQHDADGGLVTPGLVDSHTHSLFGGDRAGEFWQRLSGKSYQEIANNGGGIRTTVTGTRAATDQELTETLQQRLSHSLGLGVTTTEVKSGYGLSVEEELRHLRVLAGAAKVLPQTLSVTCLALHAKSPEHPTLESYVTDVTKNLLPVVAAEGLADWVDAFIEAGYYSVAQVEPYVECAKKLGLGLRLHADEFSDAGAALAAAPKS